MRVLLQKVSRASVTVNGAVTGAIDEGYLLFFCAMHGDTEAEVQRLAAKIVALRLWPGPGGKINDRSLLQTAGSVLVVSQFTLAGSTAKGNRPDYTAAADPETARRLYQAFIHALRSWNVPVETGTFGAMMQVELCNEGPVTLLMEVSPGS